MSQALKILDPTISMMQFKKHIFLEHCCLVNVHVFQIPHPQFVMQDYYWKF